MNDEEMKHLMIDVVDRAYRFIHTLFDESTGGQLLVSLAERDPPPLWNKTTLAGTTPRRSDPGQEFLAAEPTDLNVSPEVKKVRWSGAMSASEHNVERTGRNKERLGPGRACLGAREGHNPSAESGSN